MSGHESFDVAHIYRGFFLSTILISREYWFKPCSYETLGFAYSCNLLLDSVANMAESHEVLKVGNIIDLLRGYFVLYCVYLNLLSLIGFPSGLLYGPEREREFGTISN